MIRYSLKCAAGHVFDSWFRDSESCDALVTGRRVACAVCGETDVAKTLMAPALRGAERAEAPETRPETLPETPPQTPLAAPQPPALSAPATPAERTLAGLRRYLSENSDYVGRRFADQARLIHIGEAESRSIWGEATAEEARELHDEGIPVAPLPWLSRRDD